MCGIIVAKATVANATIIKEKKHACYNEKGKQHIALHEPISLGELVGAVYFGSKLDSPACDAQRGIDTGGDIALRLP